MPDYYTATIGGESVVLDGEAFERGEVIGTGWGGSNQCEDCGRELPYHATIARKHMMVHGTPAIRCVCGAVYDLKPGTMIDDWVTDYEPCGEQRSESCLAGRRPCSTHRTEVGNFTDEEQAQADKGLCVHGAARKPCPERATRGHYCQEHAKLPPKRKPK